MTPEKIVSVIEMYEARLQAAQIPKVRMNPKRAFGQVQMWDILCHAHYLCDGAKEYAKDPMKQRKAGSHLTAIQMCLSFANWYSLEDLMNHNRPTETGGTCDGSKE